MQHSSTIMLVKPASFGFNSETAANNAFQTVPDGAGETVGDRAFKEFSLLQQALENKGVEVIVFEDTLQPKKPDAIFPNNWVSFHPDGTVILYPMFAPNRRTERRIDIINNLKNTFHISRVLDLSFHEKKNRFLEGTGSIVFDHASKTAYACFSPRTDPGLLREVCDYLGYKEFLFHAADHGGMAIYHTNVMMCIAEKFAVVCMESIADEKERQFLESSLNHTGHDVIPISLSQVTHFAGNMLAVKGAARDLLVLSAGAFGVLTEAQKLVMTAHCELLPVPIDTVESIGGGSTRCMMAEVFLPKRKPLVSS